MVFINKAPLAPVDNALKVLKDTFGFDYGSHNEGDVLNALGGIAAYFYLAGRRGPGEVRKRKKR